MCDIKINGIDITLTKEQLDKISKELNKKKLTIEDLDYDNSSRLLKENSIDVDPKGLFTGNLLKLITIVKAANFIDNGYKEWIPNFKDKKVSKYLPYFIEESSGWSLDDVCGYCSYSDGLVGLYYKNESTARYIVNKHFDIYKIAVLG